MSILYYVYAVLLLVGGVIGFIRAKSAPSLGASAVAALVIAIASVRFHHHPHSSMLMGILVSLALGAFFFGRYHATKKPMPGLLMFAISVIVLVASVLYLAGVRVV